MAVNRLNTIDLHHLSGIVTLAEELHFGRAAARLHLSQPPLTRLVAEVEGAIGAALFSRTTRRVALTPVGEVFVAEARDVLARAEAAMQTVGEAVRRQAGQVRLAYTPLALQTVLPPLLAAFRATDHDAALDLIELPGAAQADALLSGRVDLAFSDEPFSGDNSERQTLGSRLLHREPLCLLVPDTHPLAGRASVPLAGIGNAPLILHPRSENPAYYDRIQAAGVSIVERGPCQNCLALALAGAGLLLTPAGREHWRTPGLRRVALEDGAAFCAEVWAGWIDPPTRGRMAAFVDILNAHAPGTLSA